MANGSSTARLPGRLSGSEDGPGQVIQHPREAAIAAGHDEREATELGPYATPGRSNTSGLKGDTPLAHAGRLWRRHVAMAVPHGTCRDHLANERTFLAYLRTAVAVSMIGIVITQLFRIGDAPSGSQLGYYEIGKPLGAAFQATAMALTAVSGHRYLRQQASMARGKVWASGWELYAIMILAFLLMLAALVVVLGAEVIGFT